MYTYMYVNNNYYIHTCVLFSLIFLKNEVLGGCQFVSGLWSASNFQIPNE